MTLHGSPQTTAVKIVVRGGNFVDDCWFPTLEKKIVVYKGEEATRRLPSKLIGNGWSCYCPNPGLITVAHSPDFGSSVPSWVKKSQDRITFTTVKSTFLGNYPLIVIVKG